MVPLPRDEALGGVRSVDQRVVVRRPVACADRVGFALDTDHRLDESVDFGEVFTLGWFDHERSRYRERHRRCMETVVNQSLCNVVDRDSCFRGERAEVENTLVSNETVFTRVQHGIVLAKSRGDIVRRQHRGGSRLAESVRTHHSNIGPRDRKNAGASKRCSRNGTTGVDERSVAARRRIERGVGRRLSHRVTRQERRKVSLRSDGADTGSASTVWDCERFVQVEVRDVTADIAVAGESEKRVEVCAVNVDLTARVVNGTGDLADSVLVHAVRRRVGDHESRQIVAEFGDFGAKVVNVNITVVPARHDHDLHPR